ncbi:MAG TPA: cytochrome c3 family protein [Vicinamibacterales bacterium]|nr:cytochrome c3 family protein [Vicinamibacterales bacterium]
MPQIFDRHANNYARASIIGIVLFIAAALVSADRLSRSPYVTRADEFREQPLQFSHQHHVGGIGIDCRYCHTTVETSASAGIPPTKTCMNCHSQIWADSPFLEPVRESFRSGKPLRWLRVHDLPDFVYFNHSVHVKKGMGCSTCHGRVDRMPLMWQSASLQMEWCLECHRNPERFVRPRSAIFQMDYQPPPDQLELGARLVKEYDIQKLTSCSVCHR